MPKYNCTVIFDASSTINVKADSPEEAAMLAEKESAEWFDNTGVANFIAAAIRARGN